MRMSFRGKEIVFSRYNYFKKMKRNHLAKFQSQQEKQVQAERERADSGEAGFQYFETPDSFKLAKTILHQGSLMPLAPILQPVMWSYGDCLHLHPHPDFLILADECEDFFY